MGAPLRLAWAQGQERLGALQGLNLRFLIDTKNDGPSLLRGIEIEPDYVAHFLHKERIGGDVCARSLDAQGQGREPGALWARIQRIEHQRDHQEIGRAIGGVRPVAPGGEYPYVILDARYSGCGTTESSPAIVHQLRHLRSLRGVRDHPDPRSQPTGWPGAKAVVKKQEKGRTNQRA